MRDRQKEELVKKFLLMSDEEKDEMATRALRKLQMLLEENGIANSFRYIKSLPRIEIKGTDTNGAERLITKEIRENFGFDESEADEKFNVFYPFVNEGVIKYDTHLGRHYTHFRVVSETEKTFELELNEYKYYHGTFYFCFRVNIPAFSKCMPYYMLNMIGSDVRTILGNTDSLRYKFETSLPEIERAVVLSIFKAEQKPQEETQVITYNAIAYMRGINYLMEHYSKNGGIDAKGTFYDNDYFFIKNWHNELNDSSNIKDNYEMKMDEYVEKLLYQKQLITPLKKNSINKVIKKIVNQTDIEKMYIAVGYVFKSGLDALENVFDKIHEVEGEIKLVIGSLQHYHDDDVICKVDRQTANSINNLIKQKNAMIYTCTENFYHGKFYYLAGKDTVYIIMGSSNISKTAFFNNYEMDTLLIVEKGKEYDNLYLGWYQELITHCTKINYLDENKFDDTNWQKDLETYKFKSEHSVTPSAIKQRINALTDQEIKFRIECWMEHNPSQIYEGFDIEAFRDYIMFVYEEQEFAVFESLVHGNAIYRFRIVNGVDDLMKSLRNKTKFQMAMAECRIDKKNHVADMAKMKKKIDQYFK